MKESRDNRMPVDFFDREIQILETKGIKRSSEIARNRPATDVKYRAQYIFTIFRNYYELLFLKYSRGDGLTELRAMLPEIVETWEWALREELKVFTPEEMATRKGFAVNFDFYVVCLWMISIAICLEADDELFKRMLAVTGNEGEDVLVERLIATRLSGRKPANKVLYPRAYGELVAIIAEPHAPQTAARLKHFVDGWYSAMKKTYWHDCHLGKDGGGYFGYWCFEAAAVVKAFKLDDSLIRDNPYYPKDLTTYGHNR